MQPKALHQEEIIRQLRLQPGLFPQVLQLARRKPVGAVCAGIILLVVFAAVFAPLVAPYDPLAVRIGRPLAPPTAQFFMGTDNSGRDIFSRIIYGSRISLWVGMISVVLGVGSGALLGLVSGFVGGKLDMVLQRLVDSLMAFPSLVLAAAVVSVLGASTTNAMLAIAITIIPGTSRVIRGAVLSIKQNQYIEAAMAIGCSQLRVMLRHALPNVMAPVLVLASIWLGSAILVEASLSFLALGTQPPTPSWGSMLSGPGRAFMERAPWMALFPGLAISMVVLSFNLLGDAVRDVLDPRMRGR